MRIVLADLRAPGGVVAKDTVAGGYGSRLVPFSRVTGVYCCFKRQLLELPSIQLGYLAAIFARQGHEVVFTRDRVAAGDVALVLSSLVDYRRETAWADEARRHGMRVGFVGLAASKLPDLFRNHADFVIVGEPENASSRLAGGERLPVLCLSEPVSDLDSLPFPRWDLLRERTLFPKGFIPLLTGKPRRFPVLASRGCPEFCTYCPHRILAAYRTRSLRNVVDEIQQLCDQFPNPCIVFRDPLFTLDRERCLALADEIRTRGLRIQFDCETRLDSLDDQLLAQMRAAGLRAISFGVESISRETLRRVARRPIPEPHQRAVMESCRRLGIVTVAYYVFGFLQDDWETISATINYSISLGSTLAQFKVLTPYPATPMWKQLSPLVYETDWQRFDGYTPTFRHPNLSASELRFLLGAAYARFYARPSFPINYWRLKDHVPSELVEHMDRKAFQWHAEKELSLISRAAEC
jgi:anaerobic magnesium-protoporphyrin IX monomethyl ester cyclase